MPPYQSRCLRHEDSAEPSNTDLSSVTPDIYENITTDDAQDGYCGTFSPSSQRRVTFADCHQVHSVLGLEEYTYMEHKCTWHSPYEMYQSKFLMDKQMSRLERGKPCKKDMTYRGLDQWTPSGVQRLREITSEVTRVVMEEQKRQRELEFFDPEALARRSAIVTAACQQHALELAKEDEHELRHCFASDNAKSKVVQQGTRKRWSLSMSRRR